QTPLHLASKAGWLRCCSMLLNKPENGARLNLSDRNGRIPAHYAAEFGHSDLLKTLLDAGSNIFASDKNGQTQLHLAAAKGQAATVEILLEKGADVN
ncbi:ankyrin repeat protein, partial [Lepidopterella palustris CBS 459.81]